MGSGCEADSVEPHLVRKAAEIVAKAFLKEDKKVYSPLDRLALATSPESLLVALYEIDRGVRSEVGLEGEEGKAFEKVVTAAASDARRPECLEKALRLAHELAVKALARAER